MWISTGDMDEQTRKDLTLLLYTIWRKADWGKIAGHKRSAYDIFAHKVKAASHRRNISRFTEKLCHSLGLQSIKLPLKVLRRLERDVDDVLDALRYETIYYVLLATQGGEKYTWKQ